MNFETKFKKKLQRRSFLKNVGLSVPALAVMGLSAKVLANEGDAPITISANHGHSLEITISDLMNHKALTFDIQGTSGHPHEIHLNESEIDRIIQGESVQIESTSTFGHSHTVQIQLNAFASV